MRCIVPGQHPRPSFGHPQGVARPVTDRIMFLIAEMMIQLGLKDLLDHRLVQFSQQDLGIGIAGFGDPFLHRRDQPRARIAQGLWHGLGHFQITSHNLILSSGPGQRPDPIMDQKHRFQERPADRVANGSLLC